MRFDRGVNEDSNIRPLKNRASLGLSEEERKIALQILKEYGEEGISETYDKLLYEDFEEVPVPLVLLNTFQKDLEEPAASELLLWR